jgi:hypothetical protein
VTAVGSPTQEERIAKLERRAIALLSICAAILDAVQHAAMGDLGRALFRREQAGRRILKLSEEMGEDQPLNRDDWSERLRVNVERLRARESATRDSGT